MRCSSTEVMVRLVFRDDFRNRSRSFPRRDSANPATAPGKWKPAHGQDQRQFFRFHLFLGHGLLGIRQLPVHRTVLFVFPGSFLSSRVSHLSTNSKDVRSRSADLKKSDIRDRDPCDFFRRRGPEGSHPSCRPEPLLVEKMFSIYAKDSQHRVGEKAIAVLPSSYKQCTRKEFRIKDRPFLPDAGYSRPEGRG